ncbi:MAG: UvrD-helicase domain-containing protein [Bacteroidales bacterium]|nr:UvrD-helicase domain-containing protein [Bacteroidales bacterium]
MIEIIKASAGSGKTFTLAKKYIKLLLEAQDRYAYRHILAVTFTNKATEEMKSRILKELHILAAEPAKSDYYEEFVPAHYKTDDSLKEAAGTVLCNILHDYGAFAVSTIDHFFQQTLKAFSREIGQFASYQVELDKNSLIKESVDRVLDSMTGDAKDAKKLKWLTDNTMSMLQKGEGYKQDFALMDVALRLKKEEHRVLVEKEGLDESVIYSEKELENLSDGCEDVCNKYLEELTLAAQKVNDAFEAAGLKPSDTSYHFVSNTVDKYLDLKGPVEIPLPTPTFVKKRNDPSTWYAKAKEGLARKVTQDILDAMEDLMDMFGLKLKVYNTARLLKSQAYGFGIANELHKEFEALLKEKNVLSIDDTNTILKNIIDGTETPFIYEKLGVRYEHFLLDEFQDTSRVQWDNFRPLLKNSVDSGFYNLIVGDVKQSIYRFRDSDWKLLRDDAPAAFGENVKLDTLKDNWRSFGNIIRFNNAFFSKVALALDRKSDDSGSDVIRKIYEDVGQNVKKEGDGCVKLTFCPKDNELDAVLDSINAALAKGYNYKDIAILVRYNSDGSAIAEHLIANKIRVVTDDSLLVSSSLNVRRLVSLLSSIDNPGDTMTKYLAEHLDIEVPQSYASLVDLCEDLLRKLKGCNPELFEKEVLYIQSFMDILRDYVQMNGNSLHAFLQDWIEVKAAKVNISSPKVGDAVRVITMHKSKGLDFRYVIVPFVEGIELYEFDKKWCRPDVKGTSLEGVAKGIYDVYLSGKSENTLFARHFKDETLLQYIDNMNVIYVAMTRAKECMEVIASFPKKPEALEGLGQIDEKEGAGEKTNLAPLTTFSDILYWYAHAYGKEAKLVPVEQEPADEVSEDVAPAYERKSFIYGEIPVAEQKEEKTDEKPVSAAFCSWPLNPPVRMEETLFDEEAPVNERGRLKFSADSSDFFSEDGSVGVDASQRIKGIVLHDILAKVCVKEDVDAAVDAAVLAGTLPYDDADQVKDMLKTRIDSVESRGWFTADRNCVFNEVELISSKGKIFRPDRVIIQGNDVTIVDYKFGEHYSKYEEKLSLYAGLCARMGYNVKSVALWYVLTGDIVDVR